MKLLAVICILATSSLAMGITPYERGQALVKLYFDAVPGLNDKYDCTELRQLQVFVKNKCQDYYNDIAKFRDCRAGAKKAVSNIRNDICLAQPDVPSDDECIQLGEEVGNTFAVIACNTYGGKRPSITNGTPRCELLARRACEDRLIPDQNGESPAIEDLDWDGKCPEYNKVKDSGTDLAIQCKDDIESIMN